MELVGIVRISEAALPDPTDDTGRWSSVKVKPVRKLARPVTLKEIKADPQLAGCELLTMFRLSVCAVRPEEWERIVALSEQPPA